MGRASKALREALGKKEANTEMVGKVQFEKNDFLALIIAMASVAIPVFLAFFGGIALIIFIMFYLGR